MVVHFSNAVLHLVGRLAGRTHAHTGRICANGCKAGDRALNALPRSGGHSFFIRKHVQSCNSVQIHLTFLAVIVDVRYIVGLLAGFAYSGRIIRFGYLRKAPPVSMTMAQRFAVKHSIFSHTRPGAISASSAALPPYRQSEASGCTAEKAGNFEKVSSAKFSLLLLREV